MKSCILFCLALKASISSSSVSLVHSFAGRRTNLAPPSVGNPWGEEFSGLGHTKLVPQPTSKIGVYVAGTRVDNWWPRIGFLQLPRHQRQESVEVNARSIVLTIPTNPLLKFLLRGVLSKRAQQSTEFLAPRPPR